MDQRDVRAARFTLAAADGFIDEVGLEAIICPAPPTTPGSLHDIQRARILVAYAETAGNISETARRLGVSRNTIYRGQSHNSSAPPPRAGPAVGS
jgi:sigma-54 dependent transcriptional regulator, acetoin dehydrogenase operon transcriptional activator AcoR